MYLKSISLVFDLEEYMLFKKAFFGSNRFRNSHMSGILEVEQSQGTLEPPIPCTTGFSSHPNIFKADQIKPLRQGAKIVWPEGVEH